MTIYARNRYKMWTAFSHAGHAVLNVADHANPNRTLSILIGEDQLPVFMSGSDLAIDAVVEDLCADGIRLAVPLQTPVASFDAIRIAA